MHFKRPHLYHYNGTGDRPIRLALDGNLAEDEFDSRWTLPALPQSIFTSTSLSSSGYWKKRSGSCPGPQGSPMARPG
jgi:hypothetical protein